MIVLAMGKLSCEIHDGEFWEDHDDSRGLRSFSYNHLTFGAKNAHYCYLVYQPMLGECGYSYMGSTCFDLYDIGGRSPRLIYETYRNDPFIERLTR